ncbi:MAG: TRAP transporter substrate-binding protein [Spirochaetales bacterium]|nr:TRAP transporter substrate-binding protein [Spirochaetales bacterium]
MIYFLLIILLVLFPSCNRSDEVKAKPELILRYADNQAPNYPTTQAAIKFSELVSDRTQGKIKIIVYPNGALGNENEVLKQVIFGGIDFSRFSLGTFASYLNEFEVLELPFLYRDSEHMWKVLDGEIGNYFLTLTEDSEIEGLSWFDAGARNFYTITKANSISDLKDRVIRVQESDFMSAVVSVIGANAVQIPYSDVYSSLQTLKINGAENNFPSYVSMGHSEVAKYMLLDEHIRIPELQVMSKKTFEKINSINPSYIDIIKQCAKESAIYERDLWKKAEEDALKKMKEQGVILTEVTEEEKSYYRKQISSLYENRTEKEKQIIKAIQDM